MMYMAPQNVRRVSTLSMYSAVCCPGRIPGMNAPESLQVVRRFLRVENERRVEEAEENDQRCVHENIDGLTRREACRYPLEPRHGLTRPEPARYGRREENQAGGENRRNDAGHIDLERQM